MRIYLADLCYLNDWDTNHPVPLNVGYVAAYLQQHRPSDQIELFKDPRLLLRRLEEQPPDVLALSHYDWNSNLNLPILARARAMSSDLVTVMGGPNFNAADEDWMSQFFRQRPALDGYLTGEGERSFQLLVDLLERHGRVAAIPLDERPSSLWAFDHHRGALVHNPDRPVERLDLSTIPSPYLQGWLDPFLADPRLAPIIETNRGCPYSCTYCCWGQATQSKINSFSLETVLAEIRYAATNTRNPTGFFYIADGNFGIFDRDLEIAQELQACTASVGVPRRVYVYFAKNTNERVLRIAEAMSSITMMSMSKQTLNPVVLDNVKRKNIPVAQYDALRLECEKRGISTYSELIYGLAGESDESYIDGVIATIREGQLVTMYPQLLLAGAESGERQYRERFGLKTALRVIPRFVGSFDDIHSVEYDEIVVEHDAMTRAGYFRIRLFQLLVVLLSGHSFQEFNKSLRRAGVNYGTVAKLIASDSERWTPGVRRFLDAFVESASEELLPLEARKLAFTAEDIAELKRRPLALIPFALASVVTNRTVHRDLEIYLHGLVQDGFRGRVGPEFVDELQQCLAIAFEKLICYSPMVASKTVYHEYDFDAWLASPGDVPLDAYRSAVPMAQEYRIEAGLTDALLAAKAETGSMRQAVYRVRLNIIGTQFGDQVFCYRRVNPSAEARDERASVATAHANLATRQN